MSCIIIAHLKEDLQMQPCRYAGMQVWKDAIRKNASGQKVWKKFKFAIHSGKLAGAQKRFTGMQVFKYAQCWNSPGGTYLFDEYHQNVRTLGLLTRSVLIEIAWGFCIW